MNIVLMELESKTSICEEKYENTFKNTESILCELSFSLQNKVVLIKHS